MHSGFNSESTKDFCVGVITFTSSRIFLTGLDRSPQRSSVVVTVLRFQLNGMFKGMSKKLNKRTCETGTKWNFSLWSGQKNETIMEMIFSVLSKTSLSYPYFAPIVAPYTVFLLNFHFPTNQHLDPQFICKIFTI